ncbi:hypothetical protein KO465_04335 [Candidatus Micrarchaeota archaeon]|jgi:hypothetical protein|nr:hypothetical protein [Candidatus Micrarchaeota archaeon]
MNAEVEYTEVPYLNDILDFLSIDPIDKEDISTYIDNLINLIAVNYKYEQYQFAYLGIHLLYMTYIYSTIWKISQINPKRYKDAIVFARSYNGREKDLQIVDADSIFKYSLMPEKDIAKIFKIIDLDKSQIANVGDLVDTRNDMAHASGKFEILTEDGFDVKTNSIFTSMKNIHVCMEKQIRMWYFEILLNFCSGHYAEYDNPEDVITEKMIQNFKISAKELLICNEINIKELIDGNYRMRGKLKKFKSKLAVYCENMNI